MKYDYLVVGSGLYGAIFAHEAKKYGKTVLVVEKRSNIAGNIYTENMTLGSDPLNHARCDRKNKEPGGSEAVRGTYRRSRLHDQNHELCFRKTVVS